MAAFWQGRSTVLEARVQQLEGQLALPAPTPEIAPQRDSDASAEQPTQQTAEAPRARSWWRFWA